MILDWLIVGGAIAGAVTLLAWRVIASFLEKKPGCGSGCGTCGTEKPAGDERFRV